MRCYADSSFLFSYYAADANSPRADAWRQRNADSLPFTPLHRVELHNALELAVFQQRMSVREAAETWAVIESDVRAGLLVESSTALAGLFAEAERIAVAHTAATGARSLDILHVAGAKLAGMGELVTFDQRQAALALRAGLKVAVL